TSAYAAFQGTAQKVNLLSKQLQLLNKRRAEALEQKKPTAALDEEIEKVSGTLDETVLEVLKLAEGLTLGADEAKRLGAALAVTLARGVTEETKRKAREEGEKLKQEARFAEDKFEKDSLNILRQRIDLELHRNDIASQELDIRSRILQAQESLGKVSER